MALPQDIVVQIHRGFSGDEARAVAARLESMEGERDFSDRIARCIVFAAQGQMDLLEHAVALARSDYRDLIVWAEYDNHWQRLRDLSRPFEEIPSKD